FFLDVPLEKIKQIKDILSQNEYRAVKTSQGYLLNTDLIELARILRISLPTAYTLIYVYAFECIQRVLQNASEEDKNKALDKIFDLLPRFLRFIFKEYAPATLVENQGYSLRKEYLIQAFGQDALIAMFGAIIITQIFEFENTQTNNPTTLMAGYKAERNTLMGILSGLFKTTDQPNVLEDLMGFCRALWQNGFAISSFEKRLESLKDALRAELEKLGFVLVCGSPVTSALEPLLADIQAAQSPLSSLGLFEEPFITYFRQSKRSRPQAGTPAYFTELSHAVSNTSAEVVATLAVNHALPLANMGDAEIIAHYREYYDGRMAAAIKEKGSGGSVSQEEQLRIFMKYVDRYFEFCMFPDDVSMDTWGFEKLEEMMERLGLNKKLFTLEEDVGYYTEYLLSIEHLFEKIDPRIKNELLAAIFAWWRQAKSRKKKGKTKCVGFSQAYAALLPMLKIVDPKDIYIIGNLSHMYIYLDIGQGYILSNKMLLSFEEIRGFGLEFPPYLRSRETRWTCLCTPLNLIVTSRGYYDGMSNASSLPQEEIGRIMDKLNQFFGCPIRTIDRKGVSYVHDPICYPQTMDDCGAPRDIQNKYFDQKETGPHSIGTYAKYAYRSLDVKYLQVYAIAALRDYLVLILAKKMKTMDDILRYASDFKFQESFLQPENDRIALPDEVIKFKGGSARDLALLIFALIKQNPHFSEADKENTYILFSEKESYVFTQGTYIDTRTLAAVSPIADDKYRIFNEKGGDFDIGVLQETRPPQEDTKKEECIVPEHLLERAKVVALHLARHNYEVKDIRKPYHGEFVRLKAKDLNAADSFVDIVIYRENSIEAKRILQIKEMLGGAFHPHLLNITSVIPMPNTGLVAVVNESHDSMMSLWEFLKDKTDCRFDNLLKIQSQILNALSFLGARGLYYSSFSPAPLFVDQKGDLKMSLEWAFVLDNAIDHRQGEVVKKILTNFMMVSDFSRLGQLMLNRDGIERLERREIETKLKEDWLQGAKSAKGIEEFSADFARYLKRLFTHRLTSEKWLFKDVITEFRGLKDRYDRLQPSSNSESNNIYLLAPFDLSSLPFGQNDLFLMLLFVLSLAAVLAAIIDQNKNADEDKGLIERAKQEWRTRGRYVAFASYLDQKYFEDSFGKQAMKAVFRVLNQLYGKGCLGETTKVSLLRIFRYTRMFTDQYEANYARVIEALIKGEDRLLLAMFQIAIDVFEHRMNNSLSYFLRYPSQVEEFCRHIRRILLEKRLLDDRMIQILVPGCAFGEEMISWMEILEKEISPLEPDLEQFKIQWVGVEVEEAVVAQAQEYLAQGYNILAAMDSDFDAEWSIVEEKLNLMDKVNGNLAYYRERISLIRGDIVDPALHHLLRESDLIIINNLWTYLNNRQEKQLAGALASSFDSPYKPVLMGRDHKNIKNFHLMSLRGFKPRDIDYMGGIWPALPFDHLTFAGQDGFTLFLLSLALTFLVFGLTAVFSQDHENNKVNPNTASREELQRAFPFLSKGAIKSILTQRPFRDAEDLLNRTKGIGRSTLQRMKSRLQFPQVERTEEEIKLFGASPDDPLPSLSDALRSEIETAKSARLGPDQLLALRKRKPTEEYVYVFAMQSICIDVQRAMEKVMTLIDFYDSQAFRDLQSLIKGSANLTEALANRIRKHTDQFREIFSLVDKALGTPAGHWPTVLGKLAEEYFLIKKEFPGLNMVPAEIVKSLFVLNYEIYPDGFITQDVLDIQRKLQDNGVPILIIDIRSKQFLWPQDILVWVDDQNYIICKETNLNLSLGTGGTFIIEQGGQNPFALVSNLVPRDQIDWLKRKYPHMDIVTVRSGFVTSEYLNRHVQMHTPGHIDNVINVIPAGLTSDNRTKILIDPQYLPFEEKNIRELAKRQNLDIVLVDEAELDLQMCNCFVIDGHLIINKGPETIEALNLRDGVAIYPDIPNTESSLMGGFYRCRANLMPAYMARKFKLDYSLWSCHRDTIWRESLKTVGFQGNMVTHGTSTQ
ncbi:MAG: helix-hairpin-helix domain-containing protein, partial [Candidatus Omnitrophota bacterium]